jgi:hypothetical protein
VHFELSARHAASDLQDQLVTQGYDAHRHWNYVYVFVDDRDAADQLIEQLQPELDDNAVAEVMGEGRTFFL